MRIHHLNCVSSCPLGGRLMDGRSPSALQRGRLCCHCLLVETAHELVLVDTGFGLRDVRDPRSRLSGFFLRLLSPDFREDMTALRQVEQLGFSARDVRHIVLTHLDFDHAGGLDDFPEARVHLLRQERDDALAQRTWLDRQRFRPAQWASRPRWQVHGAVVGGDGAAGRPSGSPSGTPSGIPSGSGDRWFGFEQVQGGAGLPPDILLVPLPGHTMGHAGIALRHGEGWLLQAGDAYFHHREMDLVAPHCTPGLRLYQTMMEKDRQARLHNQQRLRELRRERPDVEVFCAHDPHDFERLSGHAADAPRPPAAPWTARSSPSSPSSSPSAAE